MPTAMGRRQTLKSGPWTGTWTTEDPYHAEVDLLGVAQNGYSVDASDATGFGSRPGFRRLFGGTPLLSTMTPFRGQSVYSHAMLDGSTINFLVCGGHLFRTDEGLTTATDVTPVGVTIDPAITTRAFFASLIGTLMVNDGVNRPWIGSNLTSTPITGTYIDYDGLGGDWTAQGKPVIYLGSAFLPLKQVNGVARNQDLSWCKPGDLSLGWQQADYDYNWTIQQNESGKIYALEADNAGLRYFRSGSIGAAAGSTAVDLQSTATDDAVAFNIGAQASQTIQKFGSGFFFCDALGRPYWYEPGQAPTPIWKQMRTYVDEASSNSPTTTSIVATSCIEPARNLYLVAIWSPRPTIQSAPTQIHVFDCVTRKYQGVWTIGPEGTTTGIDCLGTLTDSAGRTTVVVIAADGYCWALNSLGSTPETRVTQAGRRRVTQSGAGRVTQGDAQIWTDDGDLPDIAFTTDRLGFDEGIVWNVDQGVVVTLNDAPVRVTIGTAATADTVEGIPQPVASQDGTYRLPFGCDIMGRGPRVTIKPLTATEQFVFERVSITAIPSLAGPDDV